MSRRTESGRSSGGGCGCVTLILFCIFCWALIFGVTINGKHYGMNCSCSRGVAVDTEEGK